MKLLILSDVHGNWPALQAVLQAEPDYDAIAFCGDVVDYGPQPVESLRWLAENATYSVRGNHDNALGFDVDCRCMGSFRDYSLATRAWHWTLLGDGDRQWLRDLPTLTWFTWEGRHYRMAHATPQGDLFEYLAMDHWDERVADLDADFVLLGHTHVQGVRNCGRTTVVNPGSIGLARDHRGQACYAVCVEGQVHLRRVSYQTERTISLLRGAPLPETVISGLASILTLDV